MERRLLADDRALDAVDEQLLRALQADGRITIVRLAEQLEMASSAVYERVARLKRDGFIVRYEAVLNPDKLGRGLLVFSAVRVSDSSTRTCAALHAAVRTCDEVIECHQVAGGFDYLIKSRARDMHAYREFVASVLWNLPGVRDVRAYAVLDEVKHLTRIPL
ncbi:MAG: AsnC family transcriptional regulator [Betaproteobacteria bacterium]|nr:MAG: AsnC family transcriptional regulator [Betaproteobacteria bacterium]